MHVCVHDIHCSLLLNSYCAILRSHLIRDSLSDGRRQVLCVDRLFGIVHDVAHNRRSSTNANGGAHARSTVVTDKWRLQDHENYNNDGEL